MILPILCVNIARAKAIGTVRGEAVVSGIDKKPVATDSVTLTALAIVGDEQADLSVHGGADKAVYAYPARHWDWWWRAHGLACAPATFGENLTLADCDESEIAIGDRFRWGDAVLEVSQPRAPCYKLALHTARPDVPQLLTHSARCGWYLRVIVAGDAPSRGSALSRIAQSGAPTVQEAFRAMFDRRVPPELRARVREVPQLAQAWRTGLRP